MSEKKLPDGAHVIVGPPDQNGSAPAAIISAEGDVLGTGTASAEAPKGKESVTVEPCPHSSPGVYHAASERRASATSRGPAQVNNVLYDSGYDAMVDRSTGRWRN